MLDERQQMIHDKGFDLIKSRNVENYGVLKLGSRKFDDAVVDIDLYDKLDPNYFYNKRFVIETLMKNDIKTLRKISNHFYRTNGIYQKVVNYYASMYRFDWYMVPEILNESASEEKVNKDFFQTLQYFDRSYIKKICGEFALSVIKDGVYYGYIIDGKDGASIQELPWEFCRSKYKIAGKPAIEFDMRYFDSKFPDVNYRLRVLDLFPQEFKKGYLLYKQHKLPADDLTSGTKWGHWYLLDPTFAFKFSLYGMNELPLFVNAIPEILDLEIIKGIDRQRQLQQIQKILVQKLPLDKNNDLVFDVDEARDIHNNAVNMLSNSIGVDVITTFADVKGIEISDANATTKDNSLDNAERGLYNALGISKNLFNTDGNLALAKSILVDESCLKDLVYQFEILFNALAQIKSANPKKWKFRFYMLYTTQDNYQAISKLYKEQTQIGFSKMLAQIALGQSQSFILNTAYFENSVLHLSEIMIPPLMSSTLTAEDVQNLGNSNKTNTNENQNSSGRPSKEEGELSDKTIQNKESM